MAVTKEQIFAAADELAAAGQRPTLEAVRQRTGGSYSTISPALNDWKARQAAQASPLREPPPPAVAERLAEVWRIAMELAHARLAVEREALEQASADREAERAEAVELADRLASSIEDLQARLASVEAAEAAAREELAGVRAKADAERAAHQAEAHRMAELLTAAQAERDRAREDAARLAGKLDAMTEQSAALLASIRAAA